MRNNSSLVLKIGLFVLLALCSVTSVFADIVPLSSDDIPTDTIGVYQTDSRVTVYINPDCGSNKIIDNKIQYSDYTDKKSDNMFAVLIPSKKLGYLYVVDISDDEQWIKVIYNKDKKMTGWVYKNDDFQFMTWMDFLSLYGRKYGLTRLKSRNAIDELYSNPSEDAQVVAKTNCPKLIRMTALEGNWVLVTILDYNSITSTGFTPWRTLQGNILLFPNIR